MPGFPFSRSIDPSLLYGQSLLDAYRRLPADLPEFVRRGMVTQPSYGEGEMLPGSGVPPPSFWQQESGAFSGPQRENELLAELGLGRLLREENIPRPDRIPDAWLRERNYGYPYSFESRRERYPMSLY